MTPGQVAVCLGAAPVGVVACWVWAFLARPKRRTVVRAPEPAREAPEPSAGLVWGFSGALVALTDQFLEIGPTSDTARDYVDAVVRGTHVYEEMVKR